MMSANESDVEVNIIISPLQLGSEHDEVLLAGVSSDCYCGERKEFTLKGEKRAIKKRVLLPDSSFPRSRDAAIALV